MRARMPTIAAKRRRKAKAKRPSVAGVRQDRRNKVSSLVRKTGRAEPARNQTPDFPYVVENGRATHVVVPIDRYERLIKSEMVQRAIAQIEAGDNDFVDATDFARELAVERIVEARKAAGLTQKQLGAKLGIPQSQISRIERHPDRTTIRTLKRLAKALKVGVRAFL